MTTNAALKALRFIEGESTATNPEISDRTMELVNLGLDYFRVFADPANGQQEIERVLCFITDVIDRPDEGEELFLEYVSPDPAKGREIIEKLGTDATLGDLDAAIKNGTISR